MPLTVQYQEIMKKVPLFMGLDEKYFSQIVEGTSVSKLQGGDVLFRQFQPATDFFFVVKGKVKISLLSADGAEKVVDIINEGSTFAEAIILKGMNGYPVNSEAIGDAIVLRINAEVFLKILSTSTDTCIKIIGSLSTRTHWLMNEVERISLHNASYRLISHLLENIDISQKTKVEITLSAPKHVIASRLSITPETLSRTLKNLSKKELLEVHENHILLNDPVELRRLISL
jgi:CRP-like cAMP-binding protein